ncbi:MAG: hypothetical protein KKA42_02685, partial [candidate division Zixibacteria bacterium]|nr:hypothetical protein [candidate division Zixibacteria bacterium]
ASIDFVKGSFTVKVTGYDDLPATTRLVASVARELAAVVPGTQDLPALFSAFPAENVLPHSAMIIAESYLGRRGVDNVYCRDYALAGHRFTLFVATEASDTVLAQWADEADSDAAGTVAFDRGMSVSVDDSYYGTILAGHKAGRIVGVVGFDPALGPFVDGWLNSLP